MPSSSPPPAVERARPLLGTLVSLRVAGLADAAAHRAIDDAFDAIARVHRLMSFHLPASDVSRLNREAFHRPITVDAETEAVLRHAEAISAGSSGSFDVTVAAHLVDWGMLPAPENAPPPDAAASWRDIELLGQGRVRFHRPLWIDLGGIAKGYAVDRAIECLAQHGVAEASVNAGGDLRILGPKPERILLRAKLKAADRLPVLELANGSVASSTGRAEGARRRGPHVDGRRRRSVGRRSFACVVAPTCVLADALTKVVLAQGARSEPLLRRYGATAHLHSERTGWRSLGAAS
jgi:FAD:protein FMN transferase